MNSPWVAQSKRHVVACPPGLTVPFSVALDAVMLVAGSVCTVGAAAPAAPGSTRATTIIANPARIAFDEFENALLNDVDHISHPLSRVVYDDIVHEQRAQHPQKTPSRPAKSNGRLRERASLDERTALIDRRLLYDPAALKERLGIAGSGTIACGIAAAAASHGEIVMWARSSASAQRAQVRLDGAFARGATSDSRARVRLVTDPHELAATDCTFVIEAIAEDTRAKSRLLDKLNATLPEHAILATTTSSLSVEELARSAGRADRFVGFHVFNPVPAMALVEVIYVTRTSMETRERALRVSRELGKVPVEVPDIPGFVVNRLLLPYLFSAVRLAEETQMQPADIDACMRLGAGHPMGPLALLDLIGLDIAAAIGASIGVSVPDRVHTLIARGALGRKSGRGFHTY